MRNRTVHVRFIAFLLFSFGSFFCMNGSTFSVDRDAIEREATRLLNLEHRVVLVRRGSVAAGACVLGYGLFYLVHYYLGDRASVAAERNDFIDALQKNYRYRSLVDCVRTDRSNRTMHAAKSIARYGAIEGTASVFSAVILGLIQRAAAWYGTVQASIEKRVDSLHHKVVGLQDLFSTVIDRSSRDSTCFNIAISSAKDATEELCGYILYRQRKMSQLRQGTLEKQYRALEQMVIDEYERLTQQVSADPVSAQAAFERFFEQLDLICRSLEALEL